MIKRGRYDWLVIGAGGHLFVKDQPHDPEFPNCPLCSPASAISSAHATFTSLAYKAAQRDGLSLEQAENLLNNSAGGLDAYFTSDLAAKQVLAPTKTRPRTRTTVPVLSRGLNRLFWRIAAGVSFHGVLTHDDPGGRTWILAASPSKLPRTGSPAELRKRSVQGDRDARTAIRWLMLGETSPAEFVRALFKPCGDHEAEFDQHWCGWNSERGRLRAGIPVKANRPRGRPKPNDRPRKLEEDDAAGDESSEA